MIQKYNFKKIEKKWQNYWEKHGFYQARDFDRKPKWYSLFEFPYPSGDGLHVGHMRSYIGMDVISRKRRMEGYNVLYPMGWDSFGLPAENYAIKTGIAPDVITKKNTNNFRRQIKSVGPSLDWSREVDTTDPNYYKWTQWIFLQFFKHGLAYKAKMPINWCPVCKIGLANEEVVNGKCERSGDTVEKREKEQWMLKITAYAEKLLKGLDNVDYREDIKTQQKNWIGKSEGAVIKFSVKCQVSNVKCPPVEVFTTRVDTLFGVTYLVLAPEHEIISKISAEGGSASGGKSQISNFKEIEKYIAVAKKKTEIERSAEGKEKTGVELKGVKAINPATKDEIPVFVADYVLTAYGTGAIMAVPAHDERDFEFARKYGLPIKQVVKPTFGLENKRKDAVHRETISAVVRRKSDGKILILKWKEHDWIAPIVGGIDKGETVEQAAKREVLEEAGLNAKVIKVSPILIESYFYADHKKEWRSRIAHPVLLEVESENSARTISKEEGDKHAIHWKSPQEAIDSATFNNDRLALELVLRHDAYTGAHYTEKDYLINSHEFDGMEAMEAAEAITKKFGKFKIQYKLRDWVFSRQRYWGEPIPIINCAKCGYIAVPEKDLPVKLPKVKNFKPGDNGESPLATLDKWVNTKCPECKGSAKRETDTMPNWAGSSWYFYRYIDPRNNKKFADIKKLKYWMPVDWYNGGMEHATLHVLYSRFWNQFLYDLKLVPHPEPYKKRTAHGMVLGEGGVKMSKSKGNVINPDDVIKIYGADALRLYEMFMGPFDQAIAWDTRSIEGVSRFLGRVWALGTGGKVSKKARSKNLEALINKTVKKVSEDIEAMGFNTAISALMIFVNACQKETDVSLESWRKFLLILAPFAPHIAEELWAKLGNPSTRAQHSAGRVKSIHLEFWPKHDDKLKEDGFDLIIQINGKFRGKISVPRDITEDEAKKVALKDQASSAHLVGEKIKKVIFVPGKIINFVI